MIVESSPISLHERSEAPSLDAQRAPLSLDRVVASLQVMLATRRAARNAHRGHSIARDL